MVKDEHPLRLQALGFMNRREPYRVGLGIIAEAKVNLVQHAVHRGAVPGKVDDAITLVCQLLEPTCTGILLSRFLGSFLLVPVADPPYQVHRIIGLQLLDQGGDALANLAAKNRGCQAVVDEPEAVADEGAVRAAQHHIAWLDLRAVALLPRYLLPLILANLPQPPASVADKALRVCLRGPEVGHVLLGMLDNLFTAAASHGERQDAAALGRIS